MKIKDPREVFNKLSPLPEKIKLADGREAEVVEWNPEGNIETNEAGLLFVNCRLLISEN